MTVKSQLHACVDSLMVGVRAAQRAAEPDPRVLATLRACLDVVERLEQSAAHVSASQLELALGVVKQAVVELGRNPAPAPAVLGAARNAVDRLQRLHAEHST
jgi:hypothetical protein